MRAWVALRRCRGRLIGALAALVIAGCTARPDGPVVVPQTAAGQACVRDCDKHNRGCMDVCGMDANFVGDSASVCKPKCEAALRDCYIECPGATVATPAPTP